MSVFEMQQQIMYYYIVENCASLLSRGGENNKININETK